MAEHKYHDTQCFFGRGQTLPLSISGAIICLTNIVQGTTDLTRLGDKCTGTSLEYKFILQCYNGTYLPIDAPARFINMRVIFFIWKDDVVPFTGDIFQYSYPSGAFLGPISPLNHDRKIKRKILYDKYFRSHCDLANSTLGGGQFSGVNNHPIIFNGVIPLTRQRNNTINFVGSSSPAIAINHIYMLVMSDTDDPSGAGDKSWLLQGTHRYNFIDM